MADRSGKPVERVTAVLPCAGAGRRFQAPYPKELHCLAPGITVLDRALSPLLDLARSGVAVRLVVVVNPARTATIEHLGRYASDVQLVFTYQPTRTSGVTAALDAALPLCDGPVVLLLPDQFFDSEPGHQPLRTALGRLNDNPCAVLASWCDRPEVLGDEGALQLVPWPDGYRVVAAAEKPRDTTGFNAVWAAVACAQAAIGDLRRLFDPTATSPLVDAPAVLIDGYRHLTTPEAP